MGVIDPWRGLAYFESTDFLEEAYKRRHNIQRPQTHAKVAEVTTQLVQGRQYFEAASSAGDLAKPLLLYYGVVALSRGLILYLNRNVRESNLDKAHGVEIEGWENLIRGSARRGSRFDEVTLRVGQRGTFAELCSATLNSRHAFLRTPVEDLGFHHRKPGTHSIPAGTRLPLKDVLARVPQLDSAYESVFGELPASLQMRVDSLVSGPDSATVWLAIHGTKTTFPNHDEVASLIGIPPERFERTDQLGLPYHVFRIEGATWQQLSDNLPGITMIVSAVSNFDRLLYVTAPLCKNVELSQLSIAFLISYALGMLVRYHPSTWASLSMRSPGDRVFPILRAAMHFVDREFPRMILDELEDVPSDPIDLVPNPHLWFDEY